MDCRAGTNASQRLIELDARVVTNARLCEQHAALELHLPAFPLSVPGQFVQLRCEGNPAAADRVTKWPEEGFPSLCGDDWREPRPLLRRPFSIANRWDDGAGGTHLLIIFRIVGPGTRWLEALVSGQTLNLIGPLGRGFTLPTRHVPIALVSGGIGLPPLLYLARCLHAAGQPDVTVIVGATTRALLPIQLAAEPAADATPRKCMELPGQLPYPAIVTTDDGSAGLHGVATDGLVAWAQDRAAQRARGLVFACGPEGMLRAVAGETRRLGLACQMSIERNMGCGLGTCLSCVVRRRDAGSPTGWTWALACRDGPVFDRDELLDYDASPDT